jgi:putative lipoprotein
VAAVNIVGRYQIVSIDGQAGPSDIAPVIEFAADASAFGKVVNNFNGSWTLDGDRLTFGPVAMTLMMGPPEAMEHEQRLLQLLGMPLSVAGDAAGLVLTADGHEMRLRRDGPPAESADVGDVVVRGTVAYRERIAMPPDAQIIVRVCDVSRADAAAVVLGEQVIDQPGNVPVAFAVAVPGDRIDPRGTLTVAARIVVGGALRWVSDTHLPVVTRGAPDTVDVWVVGVR